ncbi:type II toxin-antitoxin system RelE/ParE family toxin [Parabacteroides sp. OttesenSCG-928-J18]|nr:type II toxin-antitoxin system RelE/ParE family toxin [Parabacteroides sp. OttesenSCG-928-J18]
MGFEVYFSFRAEERLDLILDYLYTHWGYAVQNDFIRELEHCLTIIKVNPYTFPCYRESILRRCVVTPQNVLYYTIQGKTILVVSIEDTRANPKEIKELLP